MKTGKYVWCILVTVCLSQCKPPALMPYTTFSKIKDLRLPQVLKLSSTAKQLTYIGSYHSNNPHDSLFTLIQKEFLTLKPDFVLYEGNHWPVFTTTDSTITTSGEPDI